MFWTVVAVTDESAHRGGLGLFGCAHGTMGFRNKGTKSRVKRLS